jgi:Lon protease-like protein
VDRAQPVQELPLFPLHTVLFPSGVLPLHIFEQRYRQMLARCLETPERAFVVVLIKEGDEVIERPQSDLPQGRPAVPYEVGTVAQIVEAQPLPDGHSFVVCEGRRRVRIKRTVQQRPYLVGEVEAYPDEDAGLDRPASLHERAGLVRRAAVRLLASLAATLPEEAGEQRQRLQALAGGLPTEPADLSYFVPRLLGSASAEEQQALLEAPAARRRLELELPLLFREQQIAEQSLAQRRASPSSAGDGPFGSIGRPALN